MGFRVSVFGLQFPVLWFPVLWLDRVCLLKSSQGQSLHHDLCLDSIENGISSFRLRFMIFRSLISRRLAWSCLSLEVLSGSEPPSWSFLRFRRERDFKFPSSAYDFPVLWFPVLWLDCVGLLKSSQGQSLNHDLCLDSIENGISSFHLLFMISRSLVWSCLCLEVLSRSECPSWSLLRFHRERDFEFTSLVYDFPFSDFPSSGFIVSALEVLSGSEPPSWSLFRFNWERDFEFPSLVYDFPFSDFLSSSLIVSVSWSPLRVTASIMIFA